MCAAVSVFAGAVASVDGSRGVLRFLGMMDSSDSGSSKCDSSEDDSGGDKTGEVNDSEDDRKLRRKGEVDYIDISGSVDRLR